MNDVSLAPEVPVTELVGVRAGRMPPEPPGSPVAASPRPPFTIPPRDEMFVQLRLRERGCGGPVPATAIVRYELLGAEHVAGIPMRVRVSACGLG